MRYSEVLLSLAEARVRTTGAVDAQAVALLNAVRNRSDPATTFTAVAFATPDALIAAILQERNIEFLGEGLRNNDLVLLLLTIPALLGLPALAVLRKRLQSEAHDIAACAPGQTVEVLGRGAVQRGVPVTTSAE